MTGIKKASRRNRRPFHSILRKGRNRPLLTYPFRPFRRNRPTGHGRHGGLLLGLLGHHALCRQHETCHGGGVLESGAGDLRRVDDAGLHEVFVLLGRRVEPEGALLLLDLLHHDGAFHARIGGDHAKGLLEGLFHDVDAHLLVPFEDKLLQGAEWSGCRPPRHRGRCLLPRPRGSR